MKNTQKDFVEGIGNTPLIKLRGPSELTGCNIYGKAEYLNPGGSIKDRAAWALIKDAEEKMALAKMDKKKNVVEQMKKDIVEYGLTIGDLRGDATKQLMSKSKSWTYTPPPKKK